MLVPFGDDAIQMQSARAAQELLSCNMQLERHGLSLSAQDVRALVSGRMDALRGSERVEFAGGVTKELVLQFAGSPYVSQADFVEIVLELQELFYEFKNESLERIPDEDLIGKMRSLFDDVAKGDIDYLSEALFDGLARAVRIDAVGDPDAAEPVADEAVANAYRLAAYGYDIAKWVDETYAPAWEGGSWVDE
jgi:hypothetical protein